MHCTPRITVSIEAKLTSHLSISYSAAPTASGPTAPASGTAAPGNAAAGASGDGMAGFLAALMDQLLAGGGAAATDTPATADTDPAPTSEAPVPFGTGIDPTALAVVQSTVPRGNILIKQLTEGLQALQDELDKGETPDPDLLKRLGDLADAIAAMINAPATPAAANVDPETALDPLAAIGQSPGKSRTDPLGALADTGSPSTAQPQAAAYQIAHFLASLGLGAPTPPSAQSAPAARSGDDQTVGAATPAQPLPAIAQLADRLAVLTQTIAAASPELAQKLDALAKKLDAAEAAPQALAQLTVASDTDGTQLDQIVRALLAAKPATETQAAPALAAKTELPTPTPIVRTEPSTDAAPLSSLAPTDTSAVAASKTTTKPAEVAKNDDASGADAKIVAAAVAKVDAKPTDSVDPATQTATPPNAQNAPAAAPRAIPAAYQPASPPINMGQVAFEMVRQVHQGTSRFSFRLDPPELGRVDVKMHVDASGTVSARLTVERSETLDMFQRDRGALEKALSQAGLDSGKTNLEFSLKQNNQQNPFAGFAGSDQRPNGGNSGPQFALANSAGDGDDSISAIPSITLYRGIASAGGVNLFV